MKAKLKFSIPLMAIVLATGGYVVMQSQQESDAAMDVSATTCSRDRARTRTVTTKTPASQQKASLDERSAGNEMGHQAIEKANVAAGGIAGKVHFLLSLPNTPETLEQMVALIREWAESDPSAAAQCAEDMSAGGARQECLNGVALVWSNKDLAETINWVKRLPAGDETNEVLRGVAYEAARLKPLVALNLAVKLPPTPENDALIQHAAMQWASEAPEEAAGWAGGISDEALRERILSQVATVWADSDPFAAATFAVSGIRPGRAQDNAVIGIVQRWVQSDPEAAVNWVASFPEGHMHDTADENIAKLRTDKPQ